MPPQKNKDIIRLQPEPHLYGYSYAQEGDPNEGDQPLFLHPCTQFFTEEEMDTLQALPKEIQATPGRYFISSRQEVDAVRLYVGKCPDGTIQNIKQARCEQRPGQDLQTLCTTPDKLTGKSKLEMLRFHLASAQEQAPAQT